MINRTKRQISSMLIVLCLLVSLAPASLAALASGAEGGISWELGDDGTLTVSGSGAIPDYNKYGEASPNISDRPWAKYRDSVKRLVVQNGVTRVGSRAFQGFESLERVELAASVKSVGVWAFQNCYALEDAILPESITLDTGAFRSAPVEAELNAVESAAYSGSVYFERLSKTALTGNFRDDVISIALSQLDYHEGDSEADFGGGNTRGDDDYTEYGRYLDSCGNPWCSEFATWCVRMAGVPESILVNSTSAKAKTFTDGTSSAFYSWSGLSFAGGGYTPRKGDLLLWAWDMDEHGLDEYVSHTAILRDAKLNGSTVTLYTVEGNNGGKVVEDEYVLNASDGSIVGGGGRLYYLVAPDYENAQLRRHKLSFDANGGTVGKSSKTVAEGGLYGVLPRAERSGDTFLGWFTEREGGKRINIYMPVRLNADQTLYAHWVSGAAGAGSPAAAPSGSEPSGWAKEEVNEAKTLGLVPSALCSAYQQKITREEFCRLMIRLIDTALDVDFVSAYVTAGKLNYDTFTDTDDPEILAAYELGIVNGVGEGKFNPSGSITREQAATMLARTAEGLELTSGTALGFADAGSFSSWAKDGVAFVSGLIDPVSGKAVMGGTGDNKFSPKDGYTREQAIMTALRLYHCCAI